MRIHTNIANGAFLAQAMSDAADKAPDVTLHILSEHGSRSHYTAFEVALRGHGTRHTKRPNTGVRGANSDEYAATYDDWGWFLAALYDIDSTIKTDYYKDRADFHRQTRTAYVR